MYEHPKQKQSLSLRYYGTQSVNHYGRCVIRLTIQKTAMLRLMIWPRWLTGFGGINTTKREYWITDIESSAPTQTKIFKSGRELRAELDLKCSTTLASTTLLNASRNRLDNPQFTIGYIPIRN